MTKLTTQAGGISLGRGIAALAGLVTAMVLSRILSTSEYGTYRQTWLMFYALAPVFELGITSSVAYLMPTLAREEVKTYLVQNGLLLGASGMLLGLGFLLIGKPLEVLFDNPGLAANLRAFALFPAFMLPFRLTENALIVLGRTTAAGAITGGGAILQSAIILGAVLGGQTLAGTFQLLSVWALLRWLMAAGALLWLLRLYPLDWSLSSLRRQVRFALPLGAAAMVGLIARQIDQVIVSSVFTPAQFAIYANGTYEIPLVSVLALSVTAVLVPAIVRARQAGDDREVKRLWHGAARRLAWLFFPTFMFLMVTAEPLMMLAFSERYVASAGPFRILLFLLPLRIFMPSAFLRALGRGRPILTTAFWAAGVGLVLALVLVRVKPLGLLGPAIAVTVATFWGAAYSIRVGARTMGWSLREYMPWRPLAAIMGVALLAAFPALLTGHLVRAASPPMRLAATGIVFAITYLVIGQWTGAARTQEWLRAIRDLLEQK